MFVNPGGASSDLALAAPRFLSPALLAAGLVTALREILKRRDRAGDVYCPFAAGDPVRNLETIAASNGQAPAGRDPAPAVRPQRQPLIPVSTQHRPAPRPWGAGPFALSAYRHHPAPRECARQAARARDTPRRHASSERV
ncbi:hypothetical protein AB0M54_09950 [Actinoplanes sp. NPDC051470]|uniref:hypothetical protein n=1 Tax=unclassified Actinoplanes TaxID=2626549 RepID=UPI00343A4706